MMFVLPAMMLKGLHWGYTRYFYNRYWKPLDYVDEEFVRRFHPDDAVLMPRKPVLDPAKATQEDRLALCPMGPVLKLMGVHKRKKPLGHPPVPAHLLGGSRLATQ